MKNYIPNSIGGLLLIFIVMLFQTGCISEDSDLSQPLDPEMGLEEALEDPDGFPLENLRMDPGTLKMLAELRAATAKYHRIEVAMKDGFVQGSDCVSSPAGAMGFHYARVAEIDASLDPAMPEVLLYERHKNGKMKLVGVEFVIKKALWDSENEVAPYFGIQPFDVAYAPNPLPFNNYQLHVWIWKNNPSGIFTKFNPNVHCN